MNLYSAEQLADLCRQLRENAGLTQEQLAARLGVTRQEVTMAEDGRQASRTGIRKQIIEELDGRTIEKVSFFRLV